MPILTGDIENSSTPISRNGEEAIIGIDSNGLIVYLNDQTNCLSPDLRFELNSSFREYLQDSVLENGLRPHPDQLQFASASGAEKNLVSIRLGLLTARGVRVWLNILSLANPGTYPKQVRQVIKLQKIQQRSENGLPGGDYSLSSMLNNIEEGFVIVGRDYRVLYFNEKAGVLARALRNEEPVRGRLFKDYAPAEVQDEVDDILKEAAQGKRREVRNRFYFEGKPVVLHLDFNPYLVNSVIQGVVVTFRDITIRKELEDQLQMAQFRFEHLQKATGDVAFDYHLIDGQLWVNESVVFLLGYKPEDLENFQLFYERLIYPDDLPEMKNLVQSLQDHKEDRIQIPRLRLLNKNGNLKIVEIRGILVRNPNNNIIRIMGVVRDISGRQEEDSRLKEQLSRLEALQQISADLVYDYDTSSDKVIYNDRLFELFGYHPEEISTGKKVQEILWHPADIDIILHFQKTMAESRENVFTYPEFRMLHKSGAELIVEVKVFVFRHHTGRILRMVGNIRDITSRHHTENLINTLNQRYELAIKASYDIIWERNFARNEYYFSEALLRNLGHDNSKPWPVNDFQAVILHPDDKDMVLHFVKKQYELKITQFTCPVHRYVKADGSIAFVDVRCVVIYDAKGHPVKAVGVSRDITQRYLAEDELRRSNERFELASKASYDLIWDVDGASQLLTCSDNIFSLYGYKFPQPVHFKEFLQVVLHPDDFQAFFDDVIAFVRSSDTVREFPVRRAVKADGSIAYTLVRVLAIRSADNVLTRLIGVTKDITNRYLADEEIRRNIERYEMVTGLTMDVIMEVDLVSDKVYVNKSFREFYGFDIGDYQTVEQAYRAIIHPDDQDRILGEIMRYRMGTETRVEYKNFRLVKKDGTVVRVDASAIFLRDAKGKALKSLAIVRNINEAYLSEERLRKSNERYQLAAKASFDMLWEIDFASNKYIVSDEALFRLFGYQSTGTWSPQTIRQILIHPDDQEAIFYFEQNCYFKREELFHYPIHRHIRKDGSLAYVQVHCIVTYNDKGQPVRTVGVTRDITQRYLLEKQLRKANERNELVARAASDLVWEWNYRTDELIFWNDGMKLLFGYELPENKASMQWRIDRIHPDDQPRVNEEMQQHIHAGEMKLTLQYRFKDVTGVYHHVLDRGYITYDVKGMPERVTGAIQDITQMKNLEEKIAEEQLQHQQHLNEVTILTQEKEREEIGRELHDNINQLLAITLLYISMADTEDLKMRTEMVQKSTDIVKRGIQEIRKLSKRLISPVLDVGLDEAIKTLVEESGKAMGVKFKFHKDKFDYGNIPRHLQLMVFRIVQEQFNNISKYANATSVKVDLAVNKEQIFHMTITDNGDGFDVSQASSGVGLRNMRSRVKIYNGTMEIQSSPGSGCTIHVQIPLAGTDKLELK